MLALVNITASLAPRCRARKIARFVDVEAVLHCLITADTLEATRGGGEGIR